MMTLPDLTTYRGLSQSQIDWLLKAGVSVEAMVQPDAILVARGRKAHDGRFEDDGEGQPWLAFIELEDCVYWQPRTGELCTWNGRAFALGEAAIDDAATYALDGWLNIFADPLDWLRAGRHGCVVVDWTQAFDRLRDAPRIAVAETILLQFRRHMQPPRLPEVAVIASTERAAA